jgi:hypothetical protein
LKNEKALNFVSIPILFGLVQIKVSFFGIFHHNRYRKHLNFRLVSDE